MKPINECTTVAELLSDGKRWHKGGYARNKHGNRINLDRIYTEDAVSFCVIGAITRIYPIEDEAAKNRLRLAKAIEAFTGEYPSIADYNDDPKTCFSDIQTVVKMAGI